MNRPRARVLQFIAIAAAGAQAGHLVAYQARFGDAALTLERSGAHAYFLPALTTAAGGVAAAALAALLLLAWARILAGRGLGFQLRPGRRALDLLPLLFVVQLAIYAGQESVESVAAGISPPAPVDLLLWGALGQLPVAAAGAVALAWLSTRLEGAFAAVDARLAQLRPVTIAAPLQRRTAPPALAAALAQCAPAALVKRGPPANS